MPPSGGRGQGAGGRGDRVLGRGAGATTGRGASTTRPVAPAASSSQTTAPHQPPAVAATEQPVVSAPVTVTAPAPSNGGSGWGWGGTTLAEKLKQAEIQKLLPPPVPVVQVVVEEVSGNIIGALALSFLCSTFLIATQCTCLSEDARSH